jgi:hypothetical protein
VRVEILRRVLVRLSVDDQPTEELPEIAVQALVRGIDSPALRHLAGLPRNDVREARDLFIAAMAELGVRMPHPTDGAREQVRFWAAEMLAGTLTPYEASRLIWWRGWERLDRPDDLRPFVGLASEWEDDPEHRAEYEHDMLTAARSLLARA